MDMCKYTHGPQAGWQGFAHRIARSNKQVKSKKKEVSIVEKTNAAAHTNLKSGSIEIAESPSSYQALLPNKMCIPVVCPGTVMIKAQHTPGISMRISVKAKAAEYIDCEQAQRCLLEFKRLTRCRCCNGV